MPPTTRRAFVRNSTLAALFAQLPTALVAETPSTIPEEPSTKTAKGTEPWVRWLDGQAPGRCEGTTWGMPWPRGQVSRDSRFTLEDSSGAGVPLQSWVLATWPDGSLKWTGHSLPAKLPNTEGYRVRPGEPLAPAQSVTVEETPEEVRVDTGVIEVRVPRKGDSLLSGLFRGGQKLLGEACLVLLRQTLPGAELAPETQLGRVEKLVVEQRGPVRAVLRLEGRHFSEEGRKAWLPFVVRLYFHAGSEAVRVLHTLVYDGDEKSDFIRGLGLRFQVPLAGELHDRHVRFTGEESGLFGEAVRTLTGLRRDPGEAVRAAQVEGRATPSPETWNPAVGKRLERIPAFGDWSLFQSTADGFEIHKRTKEGCTWLSAARGRRAGGLVCLGTPKGALAVGLRHFWESHPTELEIRGATDEQATLNAWFWSPRAPAMDLRGYHDGLGMKTYAEQLDGLEITYEDYEPGFDRPEGVARTSELQLWAFSATPSRETLVQLGGLIRKPPQCVASPEYLRACGVFGGLWSPVDRSTPLRASLEDQLDWYFRFYESQREERRWYGFWNFGDVMHSYDPDRHEWKYDVGGFAWDNSELSTDIWLWLYFLKTGRADVFRFAEAMTRHTGEVDVHHLGRFAPLGSRHNVLHWGCSAKQLRISTAANRRYYYYLTADERVGDLLREQNEALRALAVIQANRKVAPGLVTAPDPKATEVYAGFGTDWGAIASAWLTEWERTGDTRAKERLQNSMRSIGRQPRGFFTGGARIDLESGTFAPAEHDRLNVSHLSAVFGLLEVCAELIELIDDNDFKNAFLDYCVYYNAPAKEQVLRFGQPLKGTGLQQGHSRLTAYASKLLGDSSLAQRAWAEFFKGEGAEGRGQRKRPESQRLTGPSVLRPVEEAAWVSTNGTAQWSLAAMECLALAGEALPETLP